MSLVGLKNMFVGRGSPRPSTSGSQPQEGQQQDRREVEECTAQSGEKRPVSAAADRLGTRGSSRTVIDMSNVDLEAQQPVASADGGGAPGPYGSDEAAVSACSTKSKNGGNNGKGGFRINARVISDATIGLSDGLTVPFALTAGLSALGDTRVVIFGGIAELIAGAISMGLGGYLGAKSEAASYKETRNQTEELVKTNPQAAVGEIRDVFAEYELPVETLEALTTHLAASPRVVDFLVRFGNGDGAGEEPASSRALTSALTIAAGYFLGGLLPLIPYFCVGPRDLYTALYISIGVMAIALFSFGYCKTCIVTGWRGNRCIRQGLLGGLQMVLIGGAAAGSAMGLVKAFNTIPGGSS